MADLAAELARAIPGLRASADDADRVAYSRDLWPRHHMDVRAGRPAEHRPASVVWPTSTEDVAHVVRWARNRGVPVVPFGAGSGVCAGIAPREDVVVVDLKRLARIHAIEPDAPLVDVDAGHMGVPLEQALERAGFTLGHFPSSILCSTVGGWVAARSAGQCSGAYGKIEDMVASLECVTGEGEVVALRRRTSGPDLVPLVVGSEGTLGIVTRARLRLHAAPATRTFGAWSFPTTQAGWEAMRALFQAGLRPAVARLYDPFDAMLAKQGGVRGGRGRENADDHAGDGNGNGNGNARKPRRSFGGTALRAVLRRPTVLNELLHSRTAARALGGAMLVVVFEGTDEATAAGMEHARALCEGQGGVWEGEAPARRWLAHRYSVSYRQAPVFANGAFVDTMEVAARWSSLGALYEGVRRALGEHVFVMAHFSHAYPDGCCIYFSFAGTADPGLVRTLGWDGACEATYDRAWRSALAAAVDAGGTLAHHHGVGRSKAPRLASELGSGVDVVRALMRALDPGAILNPGNLLPPPGTVAAPRPRDEGGLDRESLLACIDGDTLVGEAERSLQAEGLTLDATFPSTTTSLADWLAAGAPGSRDRWLDPADQLLAGLDATLEGGRHLAIRPAPRRAVGPDLTALLVGARGRFGRVDRAWMRVHRRDVVRPVSSFAHERDPAIAPDEEAILAAIDRALRPS
ncbi:MAG TPA: FAD-binding protein [Polyangiaceae bacterium]